MSILCLVYISYLLFFLSFSNFVKYENGYGVANVRIVQVIKKPSFVFTQLKSWVFLGIWSPAKLVPSASGCDQPGLGVSRVPNWRSDYSATSTSPLQVSPINTQIGSIRLRHPLVAFGTRHAPSGQPGFAVL